MRRLTRAARHSVATLARPAALAALLGITACARVGGPQAELPPPASPLERAGFEKVDRIEGVTVYSHGQSQELHFAAETRFAAPPWQVQQALLDYEGQLGHIHRLAESRILQRGPDLLLVYQRLGMPVIDDRDYTLLVRWGRRDGIRWVAFHAVRSGPAPRSGVVRVPRHSGGWRLQPIEGGRATFARYETLMDLGGWVPMWMARQSAGAEVAEVILEFSRMLAAHHYRSPGTTAGQSDSASSPTSTEPSRAGSR